MKVSLEQDLITNMKIKIDQNDIFDYVVGNSNYDPIEKCIDPNLFEVFDVSIYDRKRKEFLGQSEEYRNFCSQVSKLRRNASSMQRSEIIRICVELEEIAPSEVNLVDILEYPVLV
jgi:hypothetical protein